MNTAKKAGARRLLGLLLALAMLVGMAPLAMPTALAASTVTGYGTAADPYVVTDYDGLKNILEGTGSAGLTTTYVKLGANISTINRNGGSGIVAQETIHINGCVDLDLNGKTATLYTRGYLNSFIEVNGILKIRNTGMIGTGKLYGKVDNMGKPTLVTVSDGGFLTLESGEVELYSYIGKSMTTIQVKNGGTAHFYNGEVSYQAFDDSIYGEERSGGFERQDYALKMDRGSTVTIDGGTFNGRVLCRTKGVAAADATKQLTINGGSFMRSVYFDVEEYDSNMPNFPVVINGGTFYWNTDGKIDNKYDTKLLFQFSTGEDNSSEAPYDLGKIFAKNALIYAKSNARLQEIMGEGEGDKSIVVTGSNSNDIFAELKPYVNLGYGYKRCCLYSPITVMSNDIGIKDVKLNGSEIEYGYNSLNTPVYEVLLDEQNTLEFSWYDLSWTMKAYGFSYSYSYNIAVNGVETVTGGTVEPTYKDGVITWKYVVPGGGAQRNVTVQLLLNLMKDGEPVNTAVRDSYIVQLHCVNNMTQISGVALTQKNGDITKGGNYSVLTHGISPANAAQQARYTVDSETEWQGNFNTDSGTRYFIEGEKYTKTLVLKAKSGYQFSASCSVAVDAASTDIVSKTLSADKKTMTVKLEAQCVKVLENATGTLYGFKLGEYVGSTYIESDEPDKYRLELAYIGVRVSGSDSMLAPGNQFARDTKYAFGVKVVPQKGYGFRQSGLSKVELTYPNTDDSPMIIFGEYTNAATVGSTNYTGAFFLAETMSGIGTRAPEQRLGRLDITIKEPVAGESAADQSYKAISLSKLDLQVAKYNWTNTSGQVITGEFQPNTPYTCDIEISLPWYYEVETYYSDIYVNGKSANGGWVVDGDDGKKYIGIAEGYKTAGGSVPTGYTVSGTLTSFGSSSDEVTIRLTESGTSEPAYEVVVAGSGTSYSIENVAPGTYTMTIAKKNHVTREYTVTVSDGNVMQAAEIWLLGDVTGDGEVNIGDHQRLFEHLQGIAVLTDPYQLLIADINADGTINIGDHQRLFEHLQGVASLYS